MANLLVIIWYSRCLPEYIYGSYQHFWIQLNVLYPLACLGIHVLIVTYSRDALMALMRTINAKQYVIYSLWLLLLGGTFALLQYKSLPVSFLIPFLFLITYALSIILESLLIVFRSFALLITVNVAFSIAYWGIHWYVLQQGFSIQAIFTWLLLIGIVRLIIYSVAAVGNVKRHKMVLPSGTLQPIATIRSLWMHLAVYDVSQVLFSWIDKFIVSLVLTAQLSAIYYNGSQNIPFLPLLLSAAGSAVLMQLAAGKLQDETKSLAQLMNQSGRILSCIVFPLFFFLMLFRHELIETLLSEKYVAAIPIFAVSLLVLPVKAYSFTTVLQRMHKGAIINTGAVADLILACALMYPMYKWLGLPGVALSFVITTYLQAGFYLFYSAKLLRVTVFQLLPLANWAIKFIVFFGVFIIIRYVGNVYFTGQIALILGGVAVLVLTAISLMVEIIKQRKDVGS